MPSTWNKGTVVDQERQAVEDTLTSIENYRQFAAKNPKFQPLRSSHNTYLSANEACKDVYIATRLEAPGFHSGFHSGFHFGFHFGFHNGIQAFICQ